MSDTIQKVNVVTNAIASYDGAAVKLAIAPLHPFGQGPLTADGIQWSAVVLTTDDTWTEVEAVTISIGSGSVIKEIELALTLGLKSLGETKFAKLKWQGRNLAGAWVDLMTEETYAANASVFKEYTFSGRFVPEADFNTMPIELRAVVQREDATEEVVAQVKNSSYVMIII